MTDALLGCSSRVLLRHNDIQELVSQAKLPIHGEAGDSRLRDRKVSIKGRYLLRKKRTVPADHVEDHA